MLHLSALAFGSIMLGEEQNGGAALTAARHPLEILGAMTPPAAEPQLRSSGCSG